MRRFFYFSLGYVLVAAALLFIFRENPAFQIVEAGRRSARTMIAFVNYLPYIAAAFLVLYVLSKQLLSRKALTEMAWALGGCLLFATAFNFVKTSLPYIIPFYADPFFAELDKALHGGVDPWVFTHYISDIISPDMVSLLYFGIWGLPAVFFPFLIAMTDNDEARKSRFLILYGFVWIGLGNVLAYAGSSVGPIYYDLLLGGDRFAGLTEALQSSQITDSQIGAVQFGLWKVYTEHTQMIGSGISAFPSVHNGVAAVVMLYLWERSKWLAPIGVTFCAAILFASVYVGWHYAIDGYASIILVAAAWLGIRKMPTLRPTENPTKTQTPEIEGVIA